MPPNIFHTRYFNEGESCDYYNIHLDFFYLPADLDFSAEDVYTKQYESKPYFVSTIEHRGNFDNVITPNIIDTTHPEVFVSLFEKLYAAYRSNNKIKKIIEMKAHGYALLLNLINECEQKNILLFSFTNNSHGDILDAFIEHINSNFYQHHLVESFASKHGFSVNYFSKIFKNKYNIAPHAYIIETRIEKAKQLLKTQKYSITEIAEKVGYDDIAYFSRLFKNKEGISPNNYYKYNNPHS